MQYLFAHLPHPLHVPLLRRGGARGGGVLLLGLAAHAQDAPGDEFPYIFPTTILFQT